LFLVERTADTVVTVRLEPTGSDWEQFCLLRSDSHHENIGCDQKLEKKHLDQAKERDALILDFGDCFDLMNGREDKRADKQHLPLELRSTDKPYVTAVMDYCSKFYEPYAENFAMISPGNHECVDGETQVLTRLGWVPIADVTPDDQVASMHPLSKTVYFLNPIRALSYDYDGEMVQVSHRGLDMLLTPNHRVAYFTQKTERLAYVEADKLESITKYVIPTCGLQDAKGVSVSDDEIRFAAWMLTDGCLTHGYTIYQSKPEMVSRIRDLLNRLGLSFTETKRDRKITEILGRKLVKDALPQYEFRLLKESRSAVSGLGISTKERLPGWIYELDKRQFDIFLKEAVLGDGTRSKSHEACMCVFGVESLLSDLQAACVVNGYRASLAVRSRGGKPSYHCLNVVERYSSSIDPKSYSRVPFKGKVYCLTTPTGNFFARRGGKVFLTGNSAFARKNEIDMTAHLGERLKAKGSKVEVGGYQGWVRFMFKWRNNQASKRLWYHHGWGGASPVGKGVPHVHRQMAYLGNADFIVNGHTHNSYHVTDVQHSLDKNGKPVFNNVECLRCPGYKREFDSGNGWAVEKGHGPRVLGAWWLRFYLEDDQIQYEIRQAK
jgi:hypothetical protein